MNHNSRYNFIYLFTILFLTFHWQCKSKSKFLELNPSFQNFDLKNYEGFWKGDLNIYTTTKEIKTVAMSLEIKQISTDRYSWIIQYSSQEPRYYIISLDSINKSKFILDEQNGIMLLGNLRGNILSFYFEVENNLLDCKYLFNNAHIDFVITSGSSKLSLVSKEFISQTDTSGSIVKSFYLPYFQTARLYKQKD